MEALYEDYMQDPQTVSTGWRSYFDSFQHNGDAGVHTFSSGPSFRPRSIYNATGNGAAPVDLAAADLQDRVDQLVRLYRVRGHMVAQLDPLGRPRPHFEELDPEYYGFSEADMEKHFSSKTIPGSDTLTLREIIEAMRETYCRSIGVQFMHINSPAKQDWLEKRMESSRNRLDMSLDQQRKILSILIDATILEDFIFKKFMGKKSFSLSGGETLMPLLYLALEKAGAQGNNGVIIGMSHRGRMNVLINLLGKRAYEIFQEFLGTHPHYARKRGDVKYHLGYSTHYKCDNGSDMHLSMCFNPSHLEFVNPVVSGRVRANMDRHADSERRHGLGIMIHGDAAFIGEGIVQETLNLSSLDGYRAGGALHVIVNNQLGFTTDPVESRSTTYASDIVKMLQAPIFHVNGEDPEAVAQVIELALDFRERFDRDVLIDMYCYRRHGHNEGDEPSFTQPGMYDVIRKRPTVRESYLERLTRLGEVSREDGDQIVEARREHLERELSLARSDEFKPHYSAGEGIWAPYHGGADADVPDVDTGVDEETAVRLLRRTTEVPEGFTINPKIERTLKTRLVMADGDKPLDWSAGEALAFATLADAGVRVRLTGQDTERGTFSHRHARLHDPSSDATWMPLQHLSEGQGPVDIHNSPLSEAGVLGFEYGYSLDMPDGLVVWEAQFGDFVNAAQVIIDQFIASGEDKWKRLSGLVMLLPHGFEGQGPEHSSARLERFLQLCAEDNMQVLYPTTPAQMFHLLRRQVLRPWRKPAIVMTPKSLLRAPLAVSPLSDFTSGRFGRVLDDDKVDAGEVSRILLVSGKLYYELLAERESREREDVAILRLEQLYPLPEDGLAEALDRYPGDAPIVWIQEEPANMGAWTFLRVRWCTEAFGRSFNGVTRPASASPATGSGSSHRLEQEELLHAAFERSF